MFKTFPDVAEEHRREQQRDGNRALCWRIEAHQKNAGNCINVPCELRMLLQSAEFLEAPIVSACKFQIKSSG
ncbi:hypothetical protein ACI65C_012229 [Semiaphis heraclei]